MSDYIPDQLLVNVLLRLPFDSLIRCRCVSKSWRSLIDEPHFIKMHFNKYHLQTNNLHHDNAKIIALAEHGPSVFDQRESRKFYALDSDLSCSSNIVHVKQLNCPLEFSEDQALRLVGSCNGLLCLLTSLSDIYLWNPWTQKHWKLPDPPYDYLTGCKVRYRLGFGFDPVNEDYKVVVFMKSWSIFDQEYWSDPTTHEVYVYSSKVNSWKLLGEYPLVDDPFGVPIDGLLVSGALHWFYCVGYILAFDLSSEKFRIMSCPYIKDRQDSDLCILNGCICLVSYFFNDDHRRCAYISVMEDYGVDDPRRWTLLTCLNFPYNNLIAWINIRPVACSKDKRQLLLLVNSKKLVVYDSENNSFLGLEDESGTAADCLDLHKNHDGFSDLHICFCLESLVRPF